MFALPGPNRSAHLRIVSDSLSGPRTARRGCAWCTRGDGVGAVEVRAAAPKTSSRGVGFQAVSDYQESSRQRAIEIRTPDGAPVVTLPNAHLEAGASTPWCSPAARERRRRPKRSSSKTSSHAGDHTLASGPMPYASARAVKWEHRVQRLGFVCFVASCWRRSSGFLGDRARIVVATRPAIYLLLLVIFRVAGRRTLAETSSFDLVLLLIIGETTQKR